jgi:hypothetical protein
VGRRIRGLLLGAFAGTAILLLPLTAPGATRPKPIKPPRVVAAQSGFTQRTTIHGHTWISYGVALTSRSPQIDAIGVTVKLTVVDASGSPLATESPQRVTFIPAGATFYIGGEIDSPLNGQVGGIRASVRVRAGARTHLHLAPVTHLALGTGESDEWRVTAALTNPYKVALDEYEAHGCVAIFDATPAIIGGSCRQLSFGITSSKLGPRATAGIEFSNSDFPGLAARVASARISVDPGPKILPLRFRP